LLVARHAPVSRAGLCYGQTDVPTELDDEAACEIVAARLATYGTPVARVWSSPWRRARGPAELLAAKLCVPLIIDARLSEISFGEWEGRPYAALESDPAFQAWMSSWRTAAPPGGERLDDLLRRVADWHADVAGRGEAALAITHAGVIRALRSGARGVSFEEVLSEAVEHLHVEAIGSP
jgi:alpha-ribazole phosphatase